MTQNDMLNATAWILDAAIIQKGKYDFLFISFLLEILKGRGAIMEYIFE